MLISHFQIFHGVFEVLKLQSFKLPYINSCYQCVLQHLQLWVVELVTYCKKYCLIKKNKNYWSIYKSISESLIGSNKVSTTLTLRRNNVDTTLHQRCATFFRRCFNVVQRWKTVVRFCFICNVGSTLFQCWYTALKQRWFTTLKQRWSDVEMLDG